MYASVTKVIPDVEDPSKISGCILFFKSLIPFFFYSFECFVSLIYIYIYLDMVDREKKVIEKFQFETNKMTAYETCNSIWSIINKQ